MAKAIPADNPNGPLDEPQIRKKHPKPLGSTTIPSRHQEKAFAHKADQSEEHSSVRSTPLRRQQVAIARVAGHVATEHGHVR